VSLSVSLSLCLFVYVSITAEVFNRGSATPRGSAEVLQGVRQMISSEAFFSLFQKLKMSKRLHKHKQNINISLPALNVSNLNHHSFIPGAFLGFKERGGLAPSGVACLHAAIFFFKAAEIHCFRQFIDWFNQKECDFAL